MSADRTLSRRDLLTTTLGAATVSLAGCSGGSNNTPANESEDEPATGGNGDRNGTRGGNGSQDDSGNGTDDPQPTLSAQLLEPGGQELEDIRLGDETASNAARTQEVTAELGTNQDSASYTAFINNSQLAENSGAVEDGRYTDTFSLRYGSLLSDHGPGDFQLNLSASAGGENSNDSADLSLAPPGITVQAPQEAINLQEGGDGTTVNFDFETLVDTDYTPDVTYRINGQEIQDTELTYTEIAEILGEDFDPDGEVTADVTAETEDGKTSTENITFNLSLADLSGYLERGGQELDQITLSPEEQTSLQIQGQSDIAEYSLQIQNPDGEDINIDIENGEIQLNYEQLLNQLETGQHTLQLQAQTPHQTNTVDNAQIYLEEPGPEQRYSVSQNWPEYLEIIPGDGTVEPGDLTLNNMQLLRGTVPQEVQENDLFNPEEPSIGLPIDLRGNGDLFTEGLESHITHHGGEGYFLEAHVFDGNVSGGLLGDFYEQLDPRNENYNGVTIYDDIGHHPSPEDWDVVFAPIQYGDKFINVRGEYEGVKNVIDTVQGDTESIQGEVGITHEEGGEVVGNDFLQENLVLTMSDLDAPQHMNMQGEAISGQVDAERGEFYAAVYEGESFDEMLVNTSDDGTYQTRHRIDGKSPAQIGRSYIGT